MTKWYNINQNIYDQFSFYVKARSQEEANNIYEKDNVPIKCLFWGWAYTDTAAVTRHKISVIANSVNEAQQKIDKIIEAKLNKSIVHREGILRIKSL